MTNKNILTGILAVTVLMSFGLSYAIAQMPGEDEQTNTGNSNTETQIPGELQSESEEIIELRIYTLAEIEHAFGVLEPYSQFDEHFHLTFNDNTINDENVSELDLQIGNNYASHSDRFVDLYGKGSVGQTTENYVDDSELRQAIQEFMEGEFRVLFEKDVQHTHVSYNGMSAIVNAMYDVNNNPTEIKHPQTRTNLFVCNGGYGNEHTSYSNVIDTTSTVSEMENDISSSSIGYRIVYEPIDRWHKVSTYTPANSCTNGAFRDQVNIDNDNSYTFQPLEPNPQFRDYSSFPSLWWIGYTIHWHDWNNDSENVTSTIPNHIVPPL